MSERRVIRKASTQAVVLARAKWCASPVCRFMGLQFVFDLPDDAGLIFVNAKDSKANSAIHMLFMFMRIGVVWVNADRVVVDKKLAKPWRLAYVPAAPAKYFIEARPGILDRVEIGDTLNFDEVAT
jgi:uncharacterized membrane protein (UPF0127 family)